ncbi:MAG: hypothetical protein WC865_02770 [Bacteroidales bacterium]
MKSFSLLRIALMCGLFLFCLACNSKSLQKDSLTIKVDKDSIAIGRSIVLTAHLNIKSGNLANDYLLLPYANQRRWGSHERPDSSGNVTFLIPLPNPGKIEIQVIAVKAEPKNWMGSSNRDLLLVGNFMPDTGLLSNELSVVVKNRPMAAASDRGNLFCVQWESWFVPGSASWTSAEAVPVVGFYDSFNEDVIRQHVLWFMDLGVNFIMPDWSNHIWGKKHWNEIEDGARSIVHATTIFLEVLAKMRDEGINVPKVALMPGISNGPPATMIALNEQLDWIYQNYVLNPRFKGLFQDFDGKPLMIILDTGVIGSKKGTAKSAFRVPFFEQTLALKEQELDAFRRAQGPIDDSHFTIRYMSSQNQITRHHELGYWSWMDGQLEPLVTYFNGKPEAITVTPAFFDPLGWTSANSYGRRGGTTYLESFKYALKSKPRVIFLHQFNEFAGQAEGHGLGKNHDIYLDEHSIEFSDDFEPVSLTASGSRDSTGGWGFYYLNMTRALMDIFYNNDNNSTLLAASITEVSDKSIKLNWSVAGEMPKNFTVAIGNKVFFKEVSGMTCEIPVQVLSKGIQTITITANDVHTHYALSKTEFDEIAEKPLPVIVHLTVKL